MPSCIFSGLSLQPSPRRRRLAPGLRQPCALRPGTHVPKAGSQHGGAWPGPRTPPTLARIPWMCSVKAQQMVNWEIKRREKVMGRELEGSGKRHPRVELRGPSRGTDECGGVWDEPVRAHG